MNNRGSILIITTAFVFGFVALGVASIYLAGQENQFAEREVLSTKAFWLAEAGLQRGIWEYKYNNCLGLFQNGTTNKCTGCSSCGTTGIKTLTAVLGSGNHNIIINNTNTIITSVGSTLDKNSNVLAKRTLQIAATGGGLFNYAIGASGTINLGNNDVANSYNSSQGPYGGSNIGSNGVVEANTINGGFTGGDTLDPGVNLTLPKVVVPSSLVNLSNSGTITNNTTLSNGNYQYTSINLSNNATLTINGNVKLYLTSTGAAFSGGNNINVIVNSGASLALYINGTFSVPNNATLNNVAEIPSNLEIFSTYTGASGVTFNNNGDFYGAIYAPDTDISFKNNTNIYGSIVGEDVTLKNNNSIHYDTALGGGNIASLSNVTWQECKYSSCT